MGRLELSKKRMELYQFQKKAIDELSEKIKIGHKRIVVVLATGGGKTNLACEIIRRARGKGRRVIFIAHRQELIYQAHERLASFGVEAGIIMPPYKYEKDKDVYVASVQTLIRREHPQADILFIDEAHHVLASSYKRIINNYPDAYVLGLTATPYRIDGKPLGEIFQDIVNPITTQELIDQNFLVQPRYYGAQKDLSDVKISKGDYDAQCLFEKFDNKMLYGEVIDKYKKYGKGRTVVFCVKIQHSINTKNAFLEAGYSAAHIDCDTDTEQRKQILRDFCEGKYQILCNVAILTEGYNLPSIETIVLNMATKSKAKYVQIVGRGLRVSEGKNSCIIIDHGNNVYEHGMVEDTIELDIHKKKKKKKRSGIPEVVAKNCHKCDCLCGTRALVCKNCGYEFDSEETKIVDVEFVEITKHKKVNIPGHLRKPWSRMSDEELEEYRKLRGYKPGWVWYQKKLRGGNERMEAYA